METAASFEARFAPWSYPTSWEQSHPDNIHAIVIDENGVILDLATDAPGTRPLSFAKDDCLGKF